MRQGVPAPNVPRHDSRDSQYWNLIATDYDELYASGWSLREDAEILKLLRTAIPKRFDVPPTIVDLGCGTGLGFDLLGSTISIASRFIGVDLSSAMLSRCAEKHPQAVLHCGHIETSIDLLPDNIDLVLMLSVTASYVHDLEAVLRAIRERLSPDAIVVISALSRFSLRRILSGRWEPVERYRTRGEHSIPAQPPSVRTYTNRELDSLVSRAGYQVVARHAGHPLAGVAEWLPLWDVFDHIRPLAPWLGHNMERVISPR